ncbi:zinc ribbon domain-containing protein [Allocoleopsis sp.]|uniref:zinc ribbon domain-containing protein n=1 Tax=Allocoleopsis sp. TaxID=3088169 RepID=UPI0032C232FB
MNPKHTSQECSCCGYISPTNRDKEKFLCESCGWVADAECDSFWRNLLMGGFQASVG